MFVWKWLRRLPFCGHHWRRVVTLGAISLLTVLTLYQHQDHQEPVPNPRAQPWNDGLQEVDLDVSYLHRSLDKPSVKYIYVTVRATDRQTARPVHTTPKPKLVARIDNVERPAYLFVENLGRFGNHIFQFASLYGIARATNRTPVLFPKAWSSLNAMFKGISVPTKSIPEGMEVKVTLEDGAGRYQLHFMYPQDNDVEMCCFLQSWKYFQNYEADLRLQLVFHDHIEADTRDRLTALVNQHIHDLYNVTSVTQRTPSSGTVESNTRPRLVLTSSDFTLVGVHVRRQDVADQKQIKRGYKPAPSSYFHKAMDFYRHRHRNPLFVVCGDDIAWARNNLALSPNGTMYSDVEFTTSDKRTDFSLLASCNHTVISVGTFGWWGAWLSGGTVVYYNKWPTPNTEIGDQYVQEDYFPPHWVGIGD